MEAVLIQQKTLKTLENLTKITKDVGKTSADRDIILQRSLIVLNNNIKNLGSFIADNVRAVTNYNSKNEKVISGLSDYFKVKKNGIKSKLDPTEAIRNVFGIKNSGSFMDALLTSIEKRRQLKRDKNEFAQDYVKCNKKGIAEKNFMGDTEAIKRGKDLFDAIKATEKQIATSNKRIVAGEKSAFGRPIKKDVEEQDMLLKKLIQMKSSGFEEKGSKQNNQDNSQPQKKDSFAFSEQDETSSRKDQEQMKLLREIVENTKVGKDKQSAGKTGEGIGEGFIGSLLGPVLSGIGSALKFLFNPKNLLKVFTKIFLPAVFVGSLIDGIYEGFKEYKKTGDIGKAIVNGVAGFLNFLTLGIFGKDTIKKVLDKASDLVGTYIVDPIMNMVDMIKDAFMEYIYNPIAKAMGKIKNFFLDLSISIDKYLTEIEIPAIKLKIPGTDIGTTIGPWHPFDTESRKTEIAEFQRMRNPDAADTVSKATQDARGDMKGSGSTNTAVVDNSKKVVNNNTNNFTPMKTRNDDSTINKYFGATVYSL